MESVQTPSIFFFLPIALAYAVACGLYFISQRRLWVPQQVPPPARRGMELLYALGACAGVLLVGQLYAQGFLIPSSDHRWLGTLSWNLNNILIYSPVFLLLVIRKQSLETIYLSPQDAARKCAFGFLAALVSVLTFVLVRGEWSRLPAIVASAFSLKSLQYFLPVFLEGVALALLFVRLQWSLRRSVAIAIPALLFALAHVPGMVSEGRSMFHILSFSVVTAGITAFVLYTLERSRDILWLGIVHYFLDVAIQSFGES